MLKNAQSTGCVSSLFLAIFLQLGCNAIDHELPVDSVLVSRTPDSPVILASDNDSSASHVIPDTQLANAPSECTFAWGPQNLGFGGPVYAATTWDPDGSGPLPEMPVAAGVLRAAGDASNHIVASDGTGWHALGTGPAGVVQALVAHNGELYAGGYLMNADGTFAQPVVRWDGAAWQPMGTGLGPAAYDLAFYKDQLVVGGSFSTGTGANFNYIARWNGSDWEGLGSGMNFDFLSGVHALATFNGELIAGGNFNTAGGVPASNIAAWDGTTWHSLGSGIGGTVYGLTVFNGELIAGGYFTSAGGAQANYVARWNGSSWQPLGSGIDSAVQQFATYNGELIACGYFTAASGASAKNIARWNGTTWQGLGGGTDGVTYALAVCKGQLFTGTDFSLTRWGSTNPQTPAINKQPTAMSIAAGTKASFSLSATGCPVPSFQWRKDGNALQDGSGIHGSSTSTLVIDSATPADAGLYDCVVDNGVGAAKSRQVRLQVRGTGPVALDSSGT